MVVVIKCEQVGVVVVIKCEQVRYCGSYKM